MVLQGRLIKKKSQGPDSVPVKTMIFHGGVEEKN
jgi:hypothetical protein